MERAPHHRGRDKTRLGLKNWRKRLGQKCLTRRNKKKFTKIAFQIFVNLNLFPKNLTFGRRLSESLLQN